MPSSTLPTQLTGSRTLQETATRSLLADLSNIVEEAKPRATFACSGYIGVSKDSSEKATARPITIRWDSTAGSVDNNLTLPLTSDNQLSSIQNLMKACKQEATGPNSTLADKDIVHPTAVALCPSSFSTDFCPYKYGIIDRVSQMLLVGQGGGKEGPQIPRVRAEIWKLNVRTRSFCLCTTLTTFRSIPARRLTCVPILSEAHRRLCSQTLDLLFIFHSDILVGFPFSKLVWKKTDTKYCRWRARDPL